MNMLKNQKDIVLMADCKQLAKGLRGDRMGDVNLWGHEKRPTLDGQITSIPSRHPVNQSSNSVTTKCQHTAMPH